MTMEKTRVKKGEEYWLVHIMWNRIYVTDTTDMHYECDRDNWNQGNYFNTKEEAEAMAEKIRKVLKGAEAYTLEEITEIKANAFADGMEAQQRKSKIVK